MKSSFAPARTPICLKALLLLTLVLSLLSSYVGPILVLSKSGVGHYFLWQFISYFFIHPFPSGILHLALNLFLIWTFGASLIERMHTKTFLGLYLGAGAFAGLIGWGAMHLFYPMPLAGSSNALYALLTAWVLLNPESHLLLFFTVPFKARTLLLAWIGISLLIDLSLSQWVYLFSCIGAVFFAYIYTLLACKARGPFSFLRGFDNALLGGLERLRSIGRKRGKSEAKIYDFKSGQPVMNDEEFMDAMLARISLYGEGSLTQEEKKRMHQISKKKKSTSNQS